MRHITTTVVIPEVFSPFHNSHYAHPNLTPRTALHPDPAEGTPTEGGPLIAFSHLTLLLEALKAESLFQFPWPSIDYMHGSTFPHAIIRSESCIIK